MISAVLFDFGGVILTSPFDEFAAYERREGLPEGFLRSVNATNADSNAWARLERSESSIEQFVVEFEAEAQALGHRVDGRQVLACLSGELRPEMVRAVEQCAQHFATGLLTNNVLSDEPATTSGGSFAELLDLFDVVVESSRVGVRKPEPRFYEIALAELGVRADQSVFLDDLGVNLKPARAMGMQTIKVTDPAIAIAELESITGISMR
jgi:putative hydrolase of the HAD superfamily